MRESKKDKGRHEKDSERELGRGERGMSERLRRENKLINKKK